MASRPRPRRYLAAWGYESHTSGDRVEVDVWTVNETERVGPTPDDFAAPVLSVLDWAGDVAKVEYSGAADVGYRRVSTDEPVSQQSFAGAKRAAGGSRTESGTFGEGFTEPDDAPTFGEVLEHGQNEVLPVVRRELREFGRELKREPSRDEVGEQTSDAPFDGFRNVIRIMVNEGTGRYEVDTVAGELRTIETPTGGR